MGRSPLSVKQQSGIGGVGRARVSTAPLQVLNVNVHEGRTRSIGNIVEGIGSAAESVIDITKMQDDAALARAQASYTEAHTNLVKQYADALTPEARLHAAQRLIDLNPAELVDVDGLSEHARTAFDLWQGDRRRSQLQSATSFRNTALAEVRNDSLAVASSAAVALASADYKNVGNAIGDIRAVANAMHGEGSAAAQAFIASETPKAVKSAIYAAIANGDYQVARDIAGMYGGVMGGETLRAIDSLIDNGEVDSYVADKMRAVASDEYATSVDIADRMTRFIDENFEGEQWLRAMQTFSRLLTSHTQTDAAVRREDLALAELTGLQGKPIPKHLQGDPEAELRYERGKRLAREGGVWTQQKEAARAAGAAGDEDAYARIFNMGDSHGKSILLYEYSIGYQQRIAQERRTTEYNQRQDDRAERDKDERADALVADMHAAYSAREETNSAGEAWLKANGYAAKLNAYLATREFRGDQALLESILRDNSDIDIARKYESTESRDALYDSFNPQQEAVFNARFRAGRIEIAKNKRELGDLTGAIRTAVVQSVPSLFANGANATLLNSAMESGWFMRQMTDYAYGAWVDTGHPPTPDGLKNFAASLIISVERDHLSWWPFDRESDTRFMQGDAGNDKEIVIDTAQQKSAVTSAYGLTERELDDLVVYLDDFDIPFTPRTMGFIGNIPIKFITDAMSGWIAKPDRPLTADILRAAWDELPVSLKAEYGRR